MRKLIVFAFFLLSVSLFGQSQKENEELQPEIKVLGRYHNNEIRLRWACNTPLAWKRTNTYGFTIERYTTVRNGVRLENPEKKLLTPSPIKAAPLQEWETLVENDNYGAIIAQALYGEGFEVTGNEDEDALGSIVNQVAEIEQRFSFSLFAADMNFYAAQKAGWGFIDKDIHPNEEYFYKVKSAVPSEIMLIKEGLLLVKTNQSEDLPQPYGLFAKGENKRIRISWEYQALKDTYTSYIIERSENGQKFDRLGDEPYINLNDNGNNPNLNNSFTDTIPSNNKDFWYRVKGVTPFGEESPASKAIKAQGVDEQKETPRISSYTLDEQGGVQLNWEFPAKAEKNIQSFELNRASKATGPYQVVESAIDPKIRSTQYDNLDPSNYFTISAIGKDESVKTSLVKFVQTIDSIPPSIPVEIVGTVDTLGVVNLKWKKNPERDMLGYRVFRGNTQKEEFSQLTVSPTPNNTFVDTIQIKSLNKYVYYKIVAVDKRHNMSDYSEIAIVEKPDVIPPTSPVIKSYEVTEEGIRLSWIPSSSEDVMTHQVFRKNISTNESTWKQVFITKDQTTFLDKNVESKNKYRYTLISEDDSQLQSVPSSPVTIVMRGMESKNKEIRLFQAVPDRNNQLILVNWKKMSNNASEILLYKNKKGEQPKLLRQFMPSIEGFKDHHVNPNSIYEYHLSVLLKDGTTQNQSIEVIY